MNKNKLNFIINKNLTNLTLKNENGLVEFLRKINIPIQKQEENMEYFWFYTEYEDAGEIKYQYTKGLSQIEINNGFHLNYNNEKLNIKLIDFTNFLTKIENELYFQPYGLNYKTTLLRSWKKISIELIEGNNLIKEYFEWKIKTAINEKEKNRIIYLKSIYIQKK